MMHEKASLRDADITLENYAVTVIINVLSRNVSISSIFPTDEKMLIVQPKFGLVPDNQANLVEPCIMLIIQLL